MRLSPFSARFVWIAGSTIACSALLFAACGGDDPALANDTDGSTPAADGALPEHDGATTTPDGASSGSADSGASSGGTSVSGSRLRARFVDADGLSQFVGWRDTLENVDCSKSTVARAPVCAPSHDTFNNLYYTSNVCDPAARFVNDFFTRECDRPLAAVISDFSPDGGSLTRMFRLGDSAPVSECWLGNSAGCHASNCSALRAVSNEISTVSATLSTAGAVRSRTYEDGAREFDSFVVGDNVCSPMRAADGSTRCFVAERAHEAAYLTSDCSEPVYAVQTVSAGRIVVDEPVGECAETQRRLFAPGEQVTVESFVVVYTRSPQGACTTNFPTGGTTRYYRRGAELPIDALPTLGAAEHGAGRLHARYQVVGGHEAFRVWFDTQLNAECTFEQFDGGLRCVPSERTSTQRPTVTTRYRDAACTETVQLTTKPAGACPSILFYRTNATACGAAPELRRTSAAAGPYFQKNGGACEASTLDLSTFVELTPVTLEQLATGAARTE